MASIKRGALFTAAVTGLLTGCMASTEDRINEAVPVGKELELAKASLDATAKASGVDASAIEADYKAQMKIRALECSRGYEPSMFSGKDAIRTAVGNDECFKAADARLLNWLGMRRIGWLAALPPLRPIPAKPVGMLTVEGGHIGSVAFAEKAGVAVMQSQGDYVVVDFEGKQIHKGETYSSQQLTLSANGRLLLVGSGNEARIYDAESGEVLETLSDLSSPRVFWVGEHGLAMAGKGGAGVIYRDFTSGEDTTIPISTYGLNAVVPAAGAGNRFVLLGNNRMGVLELQASPQGFKPTLVREEAFKGYGGWEGTMTPAHGALVYNAGGKLNRLDLTTLAVESIDYSPLGLARVVPTANPDQVLVSLYGSTEGVGGQHLLSFRTHALSRVDSGSMLSGNVMYVPSINRNAILDGGKVVVLDSIPVTGDVLDIEAMAHKVRFEQQLRQLESMDMQQRLRGSQDSMYGATRPTPSSSTGRSGYDALATRAAPTRSASAQSFSAGEAGLVEALRAGVLRLGGPNDIDQWKATYMTQNRRMPGRNFDDHLRMQKVYVITGSMTIPANLTGANSVTFVLSRGVPFPLGSPGHSPILDLNSGQCSGAICGMYLGND
jgi:hypothetical protein